MKMHHTREAALEDCRSGQRVKLSCGTWLKQSGVKNAHFGHLLTCEKWRWCCDAAEAGSPSEKQTDLVLYEIFDSRGNTAVWIWLYNRYLQFRVYGENQGCIALHLVTKGQRSMG